MGHEAHHIVSDEMAGDGDLMEEMSERLRHMYAEEWGVPLAEVKSLTTTVVEDPLHDRIITYWKESDGND